MTEHKQAHFKSSVKLMIFNFQSGWPHPLSKPDLMGKEVDVTGPLARLGTREASLWGRPRVVDLIFTDTPRRKSRYKISLWKILAMTLKSRYQKISLWTKNLAMKKSRYDLKISLWKKSLWTQLLAMKKSRCVQTISLWKNLAMGNTSRYEKVSL